MASLKIRFYTTRPGRGGQVRRFWQPSADLLKAGWRLVRLPDDEALAIPEAQRRNQAVDAWRRGEAHPDAPDQPRRGRRVVQAGSVDDMIGRYKRSRFWQDLAASTQRSYEWALQAISDWAGDAPARAITPALVQAFYARMRRHQVPGPNGKTVWKETPAKAAAAVRVLRLLFSAGRLLGVAGDNPAEDPQITVERQTEPRLWSHDDVLAFVATADRLGWRSVGTAVLLNEWLGQRQGDVLRLPRWELADGDLVFRQNKTRRMVSLPIGLVPHIVARLQAEAARPGVVQHATHLLINDIGGQPWVRLEKGKWVGEDWFRHVFAEVREACAAGMPAEGDNPALPPRPQVADLWFMWLRHTAVTRLNEAGCDAPTIASITGHTVRGVEYILGQHYLVRTAKSARRAFKARLAAEQGGE